MNKFNANMMIMAKTVGFKYLDTTDVYAIKRTGIKTSAATAAPDFSEDLLPKDEMSIDERELLDLLNKLSPAKAPRKNLTRQGQKDLAYSKEGMRNIEAVYKHADASDISAYADWYQKAHDECVAAIDELGSVMYRFDDPLKTFIAVVAATSQGTLWEQNVALAKAVFLEGDITKLAELKVTEDNLQKVESILAGDFSVVRTEKFGPFFESIIDPKSSSDLVVVDSHMIAMWNGLRVGAMNNAFKVPTDTGKIAIARDTMRVAMQFGQTPQSVQAVTWSVWRKMPPGYKAGSFQYLGHDQNPEVQMFKDLWPFLYPMDTGKKPNWRYKHRNIPDPKNEELKEELERVLLERDVSPDDFAELVDRYGTDLYKHYGLKKQIFEDFLNKNEKWRSILSKS